MSTTTKSSICCVLINGHSAVGKDLGVRDFGNWYPNVVGAAALVAYGKQEKIQR